MSNYFKFYFISAGVDFGAFVKIGKRPGRWRRRVPDNEKIFDPSHRKKYKKPENGVGVKALSGTTQSGDHLILDEKTHSEGHVINDP